MSLWIWHFTGQSCSGDNILHRDNSNKIRFFPGFKSPRDIKVGPTRTTCVCQCYCSLSCRQARVDIECIWEPRRIGVQFWPCNVQAGPGQVAFSILGFLMYWMGMVATLKAWHEDERAVYTKCLRLTHSGCSTNVWMCSRRQPFPFCHNFLWAGEENTTSKQSKCSTSGTSWYGTP